MKVCCLVDVFIILLNVVKFVVFLLMERSVIMEGFEFFVVVINVVYWLLLVVGVIIWYEEGFKFVNV